MVFPKFPKTLLISLTRIWILLSLEAETSSDFSLALISFQYLCPGFFPFKDNPGFPHPGLVFYFIVHFYNKLGDNTLGHEFIVSEFEYQVFFGIPGV